MRNVFVIGPDKKIKLILVYPMTTGRNFDEVLRVIDSLQLTAKHKVATPVNWKQGEDVIIAGSVSNDEAQGDLRRAGGSPSRTSASSRSRAEVLGFERWSERVVVLGAGFGGLELSTMLSEALGDEVEVTLIDKGDAFVFGFSKLDLMFGRAAAGRGAACPTARSPSRACGCCARRSRRSTPRRGA